MIIYNYNRTTKEFTYASEIKKDDFGNYNLPAFSTSIEPIIPEKHKAFFMDKDWNYVEQFDFEYIINQDGYISNVGTELKTNIECPNNNYYRWNGSSWVLDLEKAKDDKLQEIRDCRSACWQKFDGLYLACERDLRQDDTNQVLIDKLQACEDLRQSLKDITITVQEQLENAITLEDINNICFKECVVIPAILEEDVAEYFNQ